MWGALTMWIIRPPNNQILDLNTYVGCGYLQIGIKLKKKKMINNNMHQKVLEALFHIILSSMYKTYMYFNTGI